MAKEFIEVEATESDKVAEEFVNQLDSEQIEALGKKKKRRSNKITIFDVAAISCACIAVNTADFIVDDIICGGIKGKIKKRINKSRLKRKISKEGFVEIEEVDGRQLPVSVAVNTSEENLFTIMEEENNKLMNNNMVNNIIKKYNYSEKLLITSLLWCCGKIKDDQVGAVISHSDFEGGTYEKLAFINSITLFFIDRRFATNPNIPDIEFNIVPSSLETVVRELSSLDVLNGNKILSVIIEKTRAYIKEKSNKTVIVFDNSKLDINVSGCPKEIISKIEGEYGDILAGYTHYINQLSDGLVEVIIFKSDTKAIRYLVDPGIIFTGDIKWSVYDVNGAQYFTSDKEIVKTIIDNDCVLTPEKALDMLINEHQFVKQDLMLNYDFSLIYNKMKELSREDMILLEAKLNFIRAEVFDRFKVSARMKIKNFKSLSSFTVVSSNTITSPLDEMSKQYVEGLVIKCTKEDNYIIEIRDENGNKTFSDTVVLSDDLIKLMLMDNTSLRDIKAIRDNVNDLNKVYS